MSRVVLTFLCCLCAGWLGAAQTDAPLREIRPGVFQIGAVELNSVERIISIPAFINMREGAIEYLLVHSNGKLHESILRTEADPYQIHVAALFLSSKGDTNKLPKLAVTVLWTADEKEKKARAEELIFNTKLKTPMPKGDWFYTGSRMAEGVFLAQRDGSIVSIIEDRDALVNNQQPDRENDEIWQPRAELLPSNGTPVRVQLEFAKVP